MTGWRRLITATVRLAHRDGTRLRRRPADGRLLFEPVGETTNRSAERVRGIVTGAWALSAEICQACGGPGDPVTLGRGGRGTRCGDCREPGDRVLPRPAWCRERETGHEAAGLLEDLVGAPDLADLMEARHTPATHGSWPVRRSQGDPYMTIVCPIDGAGWNHLLRGGLAVLLPLECPGVAPPWRAGQIKERLGRLKIHHHHTPFYEGFTSSGFRCSSAQHWSHAGSIHPRVRMRPGRPQWKNDEPDRHPFSGKKPSVRDPHE